MLASVAGCAILAIGIMVLIVGYIGIKGASYLKPSFFTETPVPLGQEAAASSTPSSARSSSSPSPWSSRCPWGSPPGSTLPNTPVDASPLSCASWQTP